MKHALTFLALIFLTSPSFAKILDETIAVNPHSLPGDSEKNSLMLQGLRLHESNDFYGRTDKLVSEAGSLTLMGFWKHLSTSLSYKGRFVQPILRTRNGKKRIDPPIGIYAEWEETYLNQSITLYSGDNWALKLDGGIGYNDFGANGFTSIYQDVHESLGAPDESKYWGKKENDSFVSSNYGGSVVWGISEHLNLMATYSIMNSKIFREDTSEATLIYSVSKDLGFSVKYGYVDQKRSSYYDLKSWREHYVAAIRLFKIWTPSFMYVSPYVKGDKYGQWYLSPLSLTWVM